MFQISVRRLHTNETTVHVHELELLLERLATYVDPVNVNGSVLGKDLLGICGLVCEGSRTSVSTSPV